MSNTFYDYEWDPRQRALVLRADGQSLPDGQAISVQGTGERDFLLNIGETRYELYRTEEAALAAGIGLAKCLNLDLSELE